MELLTAAGVNEPKLKGTMGSESGDLVWGSQSEFRLLGTPPRAPYIAVCIREPARKRRFIFVCKRAATEIKHRVNRDEDGAGDAVGGERTKLATRV
jgi:hypothetical protein